eukprot:2017017-Rhodomonas_salina.2
MLRFALATTATAKAKRRSFLSSGCACLTSSRTRQAATLCSRAGSRTLSSPCAPARTSSTGAALRLPYALYAIPYALSAIPYALSGTAYALSGTDVG